MSSTKALCKKQNFRCYWCGNEFGDCIKYGTRYIVLKPTVDHVLPLCYSRDNRRSNKVAACQLCNNIKNDLIFDTEELMRLHILTRWNEKKYIVLS